jgi:hypothetical protein
MPKLTIEKQILCKVMLIVGSPSYEVRGRAPQQLRTLHLGLPTKNPIFAA